MTRYVIGPDVAIQLAGEEAVIPDGHHMLAPALLRSQMLSLLYQAVRRGEMNPQYLEAAQAAWRVAGVTEVHNNLEVVLPPDSVRDDAMLTTAANNALAADATVPNGGACWRQAPRPGHPGSSHTGSLAASPACLPDVTLVPTQGAGED
jgi:hypothetical protein